jgi:putative ABC transport system permease protein
VAVINQYIADRYLAGQNPIGQEIQVVDEGETVNLEIIGVVGNTKQYQLDDPDVGYIYGAQAQNPGIFNTIVARTAGDPIQMVKSVTAAVWSVDPEQPVWKIRTQESLIERSVMLPKFLMQLMTVYATLALLLAAIGIYGVMSFSVTQRTYEIGLRMALGAQRRDVLTSVLRYGFTVTGIGVILGLLGSLMLGRAVQSLLFQTSPTDLAVLTVVALILAVAALFASYLPARRATRVDPLISLRSE